MGIVAGQGALVIGLLGAILIHITLGPMRYVNPEQDQLGRDHVGWDSNMDDAALFRANRGCWVLGERADREQYALVSAQGIVRQAIEIHGLVSVAAWSPRHRRPLSGGGPPCP